MNLPGVLPDLLGVTYEEFRPLAKRHAPARRLVVLISGENPSHDYYIRPRLGALPHVVVDIAKPAAGPKPTLQAGDYVLACRYLSMRWARLIARAPALAGVGLFFDDDYVAFFGDRAVPLLYRLDVARRTVWPLRMIRRRLSEVLVSTEVLRERYPLARAATLHPVPGEEDIAPAPARGGPAIRVAFHAQLSHLAEHAHAAELVRELNAPDNVSFDVVGPAKARHLWSGIAGVRFTTEMDWPRYRLHSGQAGADILIAPMLDTPLNQARAATKAIDATRMGAAAIFPRAKPYLQLAGSAVLVDGGMDAWHAALRRLIGDGDERRRLAERLRAEVAGWREHVAPLPPEAS
jgi:hypothetical protein